ncbi:MAG: 4-alpha-glucanotransferase [Spirochaetaceae bacterium]|jgi:4-alpha-glucanotransferase|nr:4-alpha-glucanotransferase [Spirochaetaceae bacterium]
MTDLAIPARGAGILLACSSLPSPYGFGCFGEDARRWLRFLKRAGQKYWQILPLGVTGWGDSPYQSFSAFAISPYYIDLDALAARGLVSQEAISGGFWGRSQDKVNYSALYKNRGRVLSQAAEAFFQSESARADSAPFAEFCARHQSWLDDYALFMALKSRHSGAPWLEWEDIYKFRDDKALRRFSAKNEKLVMYYRFEQYTAYEQWLSLREEARSLGVSIIGDMPIYVALDSADVWSHPELFELDGARRPIRVAGCPPDPFSASGQLWGNPLYRWDRHRETGFEWWLSRLKESFAIYDTLRIDHFRGLESYYAINAGESDARNGVWVKGPDRAFIDAVRAASGGLSIIAEDLGYLSAEVKALLEYSGYPGMKVLQFAFDSRESGDYMPHNYERNCVVYTGTHDNTTSAQWFKSARQEDVSLALEYLGARSAKNGHLLLVRAALASVANLAVIPLQDYLGLDGRARMNTPSTLGTNWQWRVRREMLTDGLSADIAKMTELYGRAPA